MVAKAKVGDALAERLDDSGGFVAERHRQGAGSVAVDDGEVGMAQARGGDPDEDFTAAGRREVERFERQRLRARIG